jgi:hypothetical protein
MDINQFHHYPGGVQWLDCEGDVPGLPTILGEFATTATDVWPDMSLQSQRVLDRLRLARDQGCSLALPWSFLARDRHTSWSPEVQLDIETFTREEPSHDL